MRRTRSLLRRSLRSHRVVILLSTSLEPIRTRPTRSVWSRAARATRAILGLFLRLPTTPLSASGALTSPQRWIPLSRPMSPRLRLAASLSPLTALRVPGVGRRRPRGGLFCLATPGGAPGTTMRTSHKPPCFSSCAASDQTLTSGREYSTEQTAQVGTRQRRLAGSRSVSGRRICRWLLPTTAERPDPCLEFRYSPTLVCIAITAICTSSALEAHSTSRMRECPVSRAIRRTRRTGTT